MPAETTDPLSTAILVGFIVSLLTVIYREMKGQLADRDARIEKLEKSVEDMAARSSSLAGSADRMLNYFLDREAAGRDGVSPPREGGPKP